MKGPGLAQAVTLPAVTADCHPSWLMVIWEKTSLTGSPRFQQAIRRSRSPK